MRGLVQFLIPALLWSFKPYMHLTWVQKGLIITYLHQARTSPSTYLKWCELACALGAKGKERKWWSSSTKVANQERSFVFGSLPTLGWGAAIVVVVVVATKYWIWEACNNWHNNTHTLKTSSMHCFRWRFSLSLSLSLFLSLNFWSVTLELY
jgi:hypothetical protein